MENITDLNVNEEEIGKGREEGFSVCLGGMEGHTNGGRQSSACFLRTENPPWVLVSEAVRIFMNIPRCIIAGEETEDPWGDGDACSLSS